MTLEAHSPQELHAAADALGRRFRVLFVDDHAETREFITELLRQAGYEVWTADSFAHGVQVAQSAEFDLYLLDIRLPDGDGIELCRMLQWLTPGVPTVFYSGREDLNLQCEERCGSRFLLKPARVEDIERVIREALLGY